MSVNLNIEVYTEQKYYFQENHEKDKGIWIINSPFKVCPSYYSEKTGKKFKVIADYYTSFPAHVALSKMAEIYEHFPKFEFKRFPEDASPELKHGTYTAKAKKQRNEPMWMHQIHGRSKTLD